MNFDQTSDFDKDLKHLAKKWRSLPDDIEYIKPNILSLYVERDDIDIQKYRDDLFATKKAAIITVTPSGVEIIKIRLDVAAIGNNSKVRIVFVAARQANTITFIEIYAKNEKDREDQARIRRYL
jgi:hypothetical protein